MSVDSPQHLTDDEIETRLRRPVVTASGDPQDADGTDTGDADGTDADGTDGDATDTTDGDAGDADGRDS